MKQNIKPPSLIQQQYLKELKRLKQLIKRAEKKGFTFPETIIPTTPKRITQSSVSRLQKLTPEKVYSKAITTPAVKQPKAPTTQHKTKRPSRSTKATSTTPTLKTPGVTTSQPLTEEIQPSPYIDEYRKQRRRVKNLIRNIKKRGYNVPDFIVPPLTKTPTEEDVAKLKRINPNYIYPRSTWVDPQTGEVYAATYRRQIERQEAAGKAAETRAINNAEAFRNKFWNGSNQAGTATPETAPKDAKTILQIIRDMINDWSPDSTWTKGLTKAKQTDKGVLKSMLDASIELYGEDAVAANLEKNAMYIVNLVNEILYASGSKEGNFRDGRTQVNADLVTFATFLRGGPLSQQESEYLTTLGEGMEVNN